MKYWTISFDKDGSKSYDHVVADDIMKAIEYTCKKNGIDSSAITFMSGEGTDVAE